MDIKLLFVAAVAACALVGCDEQEDLSKYARWEPIHILGKEKTYYCQLTGGPGTAMDRSYMPMMGGWGEGRGLNKIVWFNVWANTNKKSRIVYPYTPWETFGPKEYRKEGVEAFKKFTAEHPDRPIMLRGFLDSWFPWFMEDTYDCDAASFRNFKKIYTNVVAFTTLNESDGGFGHFNSKQVTNAAMKAKMDAAFPPAENYRDRVNWVAKAMERQRAMYGGIMDFSVTYSVNPKWGHVIAQHGIPYLAYEAESCVSSGPWRFGMMHVRGAGRQYQIPWTWYTAQLIYSATRDGKDVHSEWFGPTEWCQTWYKRSHNGQPWKENCGTARSIIKRAHIYGYLAGANVSAYENSQYWLMDRVNGTNVLSKYGRDVEEVMQFAEKTPRGFCYTPLALLTGYYEGAGREGGNGYGGLGFYLTLVPILSEDGYRCCERKKGDQGILFNSEFGEICDVLTPDAGQKPGAFAAALAPYKWAYLLGKFDTNQFERAAVESWVKAGGTLVVSVDNVGGDLISENMVGVAFTTNVAACGSQLIEAATKRVCEGSMRQTFKRTLEWDKKTYTAPMDYQLTLGTPLAAEKPEQQAKPLFVDEDGNVVVWEHAVGKGRVLTMAVYGAAPRILVHHKKYYKELPINNGVFGINPEFVAGRITFPMQREILRKCQRETMPVTVEGDIQWGVNKVRSKSEEGRSEGSHWLVWLINNKGVKKFAYEEEEIDHAFDAKVKITDRRTGKVYEKLVPAGGYGYVEID